MYYRQNSGFIKSIIIVIAGVILLGIFGVDLKETISEGKVHDNLVYVWEIVRQVWNNYVERPINFVWGVFYNNIWLSFWPSLVETLRGFEFFKIDSSH
ncbi:hypothetical protein ACFLY5_01255 [Patescibacteria group bacterium]